MEKRMQKHIVFIWYLTTLIVTGGLLCLHFVWKSVGEYSVSFTQFGPMLATLLLLCITKDKLALSDLQNGLLFRRKYVVFYVAAAILPLGFMAMNGWLLAVLFHSPYLPWKGDTIFYTLNFAAILLGSMGEEVGRRGYLLPKLNKKFTPFFASILVGCLWGFWHLNYAGDILFWILFTITTIELSVIFTFFMYRTKGNLWTVILLHTFFNVANRVFVWERFHAMLLFTEMILLGLVCMIIVIGSRGWIFQKLR